MSLSINNVEQRGENNNINHYYKTNEFNYSDLPLLTKLLMMLKIETTIYILVSTVSSRGGSADTLASP